MRILALLALLAAQLPAAEFRAAAARMEITPAADAGLKMSGYAARTEGSTGVHDPLYVRALVLDDGSGPVAIISAEVIGFGEAAWRRMTGRIQKELDIPPGRVLLTAVHTHGAPSTGMYEPVDENQRAWIAHAEDQVVAAVKQAQGSLRAARFGFGTGRVNVNVNRRQRMPDGTWSIGKNPNGPSDKNLAVLRFDDLAGRPIAVLANYAVHGVVMGEENREITSDLPGAASRYVEEQFGPNMAALWTSGAAGDQNPIYGPGNDFDKVSVLGQLLGAEIVKVAKAIETKPTARIRAAQKVITCPGQRLAPGATPKQPAFVDAEPVAIRLSLMRIGPIELAGVSGEVLTGIQAHVRRVLGPKEVMVTHANGSSGYLPDDAAYEQVSYEILTANVKRGCADTGIVKGFTELMKK